MRKTLIPGAALAGGLLVTTLVWGSAQATSAPDLKGALGTTGAVTLVGHGGGHGGDGGGGGGGRAAISGGAGHAYIAGGGNRAFSTRSLSGNNGHFKSGHMAGNDISGVRSYSKRNLSNGQAFKGRDRYAGDNWKSGKHHDDNDHVAMRDHDHNHFKGHRVFRNGVWVSVYGTGYYAGDDCYWLLRQAEATGSYYWWSRYNACVSYY